MLKDKCNDGIVLCQGVGQQLQLEHNLAPSGCVLGPNETRRFTQTNIFVQQHLKKSNYNSLPLGGSSFRQVDVKARPLPPEKHVFNVPAVQRQRFQKKKKKSRRAKLSLRCCSDRVIKWNMFSTDASLKRRN